VLARLFLTFPQRLVQEPVLHDLLRRFPVKANIRGASVTDEIALMALHVEGEEADVKAAISWLEGLGVSIEDLAE
jgi:ABC-type methionine transport system ATPase subunit